MDELRDKSKRTRGPSWDPALIAFAKERRRVGDSNSEIRAAIRRRHGQEVPVSTVKYWTDSVRPDGSGEWRLDACLPAEADPAVVLPVVAAVVWQSGGRVTSLTNAQARWITLIDRVRPDLAWNAYDMARRFIEAAEDKDELHRLQELLAVGAARLRWPELEGQIARLEATARRVKADLDAGRHPFLDGTPYIKEADHDAQG